MLSLQKLKFAFCYLGDLLISLIAISIIKDALNRWLGSMNSTLHNPLYRWTDYWLFLPIILFIICLAFFILVGTFNIQSKRFFKKEALAVTLSFFLIPLFIPYNPLPTYFQHLEDFALLGEYFFEIMEIGIAGSLIPVIYTVLKKNEGAGQAPYKSDNFIEVNK